MIATRHAKFDMAIWSWSECSKRFPNHWIMFGSCKCSDLIDRELPNLTTWVKGQVINKWLIDSSFGLHKEQVPSIDIPLC